MAASKDSDHIVFATHQYVYIYSLLRTGSIGEKILAMTASNVSKLDMCLNYVAYYNDVEVFVVYYELYEEHKADIDMYTLCETTMNQTRERNERPHEYNSFVLENVTLKSFKKLKAPIETKIISDYADKNYTYIEFDAKNESNLVPGSDITPYLRPDAHSNSVEEVLGPVQDIHTYSLNPKFKLRQSNIAFYKKLAQPLHTLHLNVLKLPGVSKRRIHLFLSVPLTGYLYYLSNSSTEMLSIYPYPQATLAAFPTDSFLYVLTEEGIEYYVMRYYDPIHFKHLNPTSITPIDFGFSVNPIMFLWSMAPNANGILILTKTFVDSTKPGIKSNSTPVKSKRDVGWNVSIVNLKKSYDIVEEIHTIVLKSVKFDHPIFFLLVFELYALIHAIILATYVGRGDQSKLEHFESLKKEAFGMIGEYFSDKHEFTKASHFWSYANRPIKKIAKDLLITYRSNPKKNANALKGFFDCLSKAIKKHKTSSFFDDEEVAFIEDVISVCFDYAPNQLGQLILSAGGYFRFDGLMAYIVNAKTKLKLKLQDDWGSFSTKTPKCRYGASSEDEQNLWELILAIVLINLSKGNVDIAKDALDSVPEVFIVAYTVAHPWLLLDEVDMESETIPPFNQDSKPSSFAHCLYDSYSFVLLEILVKTNMDDSFATMLLSKSNLLLILYYESKILRGVSENFTDTCMNLIKLYIEMTQLPNDQAIAMIEPVEITSQEKDKTVNYHAVLPKTNLENIWKEFHNEFLLEERARWFDFLTPFSISGDTPAQQDFYGTNKGYFYVQKLQRFLCMLESTSRLEIIQSCSNLFIDSDTLISLNLLSKVHNTGILVAFEIILHRFPHISLEFCKRYCQSQDDWRQVWNLLLENLKSKVNSHEDAREGFVHFLNHLSRTLTPKVFLSMIPDEGNAHFFLPFIEQNLNWFHSRELLNELKEIQ